MWTENRTLRRACLRMPATGKSVVLSDEAVGGEWFVFGDLLNDRLSGGRFGDLSVGL